MSERFITVFFYGSYIDRNVLAEVSVSPLRWEVGRLAGYELVVQPRANLNRSEADTVYGVVASATHTELQRLYTEHSLGALEEPYFPEAVLVESLTGSWMPALCYIAHSMPPRPAASVYIDRIVASASGLGFPAWYIERIRRWRV
jgi:hypothetical protein